MYGHFGRYKIRPVPLGRAGKRSLPNKASMGQAVAAVAIQLRALGMRNYRGAHFVSPTSTTETPVLVREAE
jgi:hypothetical protein